MNNQTKLFGVLGDPINHSKSPLMMNRAFQTLGMDAAYYAFQIKQEQLKEAVQGLRALGFGGANVTIPHKEAVIEHLDELDESAKWIGAVNTIVNRDGKLVGYNTDGIGFVRSLIEETKQSVEGKNIVVLGAGGAARGIIYALCKQNAQMITIANRTPERAKQLAEDFKTFGELRGIGSDDLDQVMNDVHIVINTTSLGMHPNVDTTPINVDLLQEGMVASDIVYTPWTTRFLREAGERGCRIHRGLGMFVYQGAFAFEYWTGKQAPVDQMRAIVEQSLTES